MEEPPKTSPQQAWWRKGSFVWIAHSLPRFLLRQWKQLQVIVKANEGKLGYNK